MVDAAMSDGAALVGAMTYGLRAAGHWRDEREANLLDGGVPNYAIYRCSDGKFLAVGAIEPQFRQALFKGLALADGRGTRGDRGSHQEPYPRRMGGAFRGHRSLRGAGARPRRSAGASAQYRPANLSRPGWRVPTRAIAPLLGDGARPARAAEAGWRGRRAASLNASAIRQAEIAELRTNGVLL